MRKKQYKAKEKFNFKKEVRLLPGYIILSIWILFTAIILGWILAASLSTSKEIYTGTVLQFESGFHFSNYIDAWNAQNISVFLGNSLFYATTSCVGTLLISAPAAYVLARFKFIGNKKIKSSFIFAMSIPSVMIILPLFHASTQIGLSGTRFILIILYICINVPFATTFLLNFFSSLSGTYEEAAAIDGCSPMGTFWKIMLPLAQPGLITVGIFLFLNVWNEYFMALIFASSDDLKNVGVGLFSLVSAMRSVGNMGGLFAAVVIVFLPTFILYIFLSEKIISGVTGGGVKG